MSAPKSERWYPSKQQLDTPEKSQAAIRRVLDLHYQLQDAHNDLKSQIAAPAGGKSNVTSSSPTSQQLLGLPVAPVNTQSLADGATLKWSKANGHFTFS